MVYIRPSVPVAPSTPLKPVGEPVPAQDQGQANNPIVNEYIVKPETERRRQQQDRRQQKRDALLETRAGRDRRKNKSVISVSV
jgi:hypothetical protein